MFRYTDNPVRDAEATASDFQQWLDTRPVCKICEKPVQEDHYFTDGCIEVCCPGCWGQYCLDNFLVDIKEEE